MNFSDACSAIKAQIDTAWALQGHGDIPILYPNTQRPTFDAAQKQLHVEIRPGAANIAAFGGRGDNRNRQSGEVIFRILTPFGAGETDSATLADDAASILRGFASGDLRFDAGPPPQIGGGSSADENGVFYQRDVIAPFIYDLIG